MNIGVYPDADALSHAAALYVLQVANEAIVTHGRFTLALSGGTTPQKLYSLLGTAAYAAQINWALVEVFWSDERCVPPASEESNYRMAHEALLSKVPIPPAQIHRMPADAEDLDSASQAYTLEMQRVCSTDRIPRFDLMQLGMGPEGHTASLFPHQPSLHEQQRLVMPVTVPKPPPARLTFTPPLLNAASHILFLVTGAEKAEAVRAVLEGSYQPDEYPAQIVRPTQGEVAWLLDTAAAQKLNRS